MKRQGRQKSPYQLERLQVIQAWQRRAREKPALRRGQLVYYGPMPAYYGIGEVKRVAGPRVAVDFRGTGTFGVHEEIIETRYLIRIPRGKLAQL